MPTTALVLSNDSIDAWTENKKVLLFGNGSIKCDDLVSKIKTISIVENINPSVSGMVKEATKSYANKQFEDLINFEPFYLKDFITSVPKKNILNN